MRLLKNTSLFVMTFFLAFGMRSLNAQDITHPHGGTWNYAVPVGVTVNYYDDGGPACSGKHGRRMNSTAIICPDSPGSAITVEFLDVDLKTINHPSYPCDDFISIFDGPSTEDALLFFGCGEDGFADYCSNGGSGDDAGGVEGGPHDMNGSNSDNPANNIYTSSHVTGCLTFKFESDLYQTRKGWAALVTANAVDGGATCSDGIQNGDETGVDCGGYYCPYCPGTIAECYDLTLNFDYMPSETSWEITNIDGTVAAGRPEETYWWEAFHNSTFIENICLPVGCYEFTIFDTWGNGMCCDPYYGYGSYVFSGNDGVIASGGAFGYAETTSFCTDPGADCIPPSATASVINNCANGTFYVQVTLTDLGSASTVTISNNGGAYNFQNVIFPRMYSLGPFTTGTPVDILIYNDENTACRLMLENNIDACGNLVPNNNPENNSFGVFPNPTTGEVNVNVSQYIGQNANIQIYNTLGQLISQRQLNDIQTTTEQFDLSSQESGVYMISIDVEGMGKFTERIMLSGNRL